jgi:type II secretory pathway pseudopilin PulG
MKKNGGGFTILETMIVMTVSATMLASAIILFSGQQRKTQFSQSLRDAESKIQDVLNDVATGYFPNAGSISCSANGGNEPSINTLGASEQGSNYECVFMGKALWIRPDGFSIYPIVGNRTLASSATTTSTLATVRPILPRSPVESILIESKSFLWDSRVYAIYWNDNANRSTNGAMIAIASTANGTGTASSGAGFNSGIQRLNMYSSGVGIVAPVSVNEAVASSAESAMKTALNSATLSWVPGNKVVLCIEDSPSGAGRQFGGIVITGGNEGVEARIQQFGDGRQCA